MYCGKCGAQIPDDSVFCTQCGNNLTDTVQATESSSSINQEATVEQTPVQPVYVQPDIAQNNMGVAPNNKKKYLLIGGIAIGVVVLVIIIVVFIIVHLTSSNKLSVNDVKESYMYYYSDTRSLGEVFEDYDYFDNIKWDEFDGVTDDGESVDVVEAICDVTVPDPSGEAGYYYTVQLTFQFYRDDTMDNDECELYGIFAVDYSTDTLEDQNVSYYDDGEWLMECIYSDFELEASDIWQDLYY